MCTRDSNTQNGQAQGIVPMATTTRSRRRLMIAAWATGMGAEINRLQFLPATSISMAQCRSGIAQSLYGTLRLQGWRMGVWTGCQELPMAIGACTMSKHFLHMSLLLPPGDSQSKSNALSPTESESHALRARHTVVISNTTLGTMVLRHFPQGTVWSSFSCD